MTAIVYRKLGENRDRGRLWLQGQRLASQGIQVGMAYAVEYDHAKKRLVVRFSETGTRVVSRKKKPRSDLYEPVIDIESHELRDVFGSVDRVRVVIKPEGLLVTIHHQDATERERFARFVEKVKAVEPLNVGSLAHGVGGLDLAIHRGLASAGIASRLAWAVEIEGEYLDASQRNNPIWDEHSLALEAGMEEVEASRLPPVEILLAGLPCVGASMSGRAKNGLKAAEEHETAGTLFIAFLDFIKTLNPGVVLLENVVPYQNTVSMGVIRSVLGHLGYEVHEEVLNGNEMGALENRDRMCMIAVTRGIAFDFEGIKPVRHKETNIAQILDAVPEDSDRWKTFSYLNDKQERDKAAGKGFRRQLLDGSESSCGTIGRGYAKARSTEPFLVHPSGDGRQRLFTPAEHARVKTIPQELIAGMSDTRAHEVLGNSVIYSAFVAVGKHLGNAVQNLFDGHTETQVAA